MERNKYRDDKSPVINLPTLPLKTEDGKSFFIFNLYTLALPKLLRPEGGSKDKKCPILIFQYVTELEKTNKIRKREVNLTSPSRDIVPQSLRFTYNCIGSLNFKRPYLWTVFSTSAPLSKKLA